MNITFNSHSPVYLQVIHYYKVLIASGEIEPGDEMPSRRELAKKFKINPNTVQRAYKEMEEQGLIFTEGNMPSKVTKDKNLLHVVRDELLMEAVDDLFKVVKPIHVPINELISLIKDQYEDESKEG